MRIDDLESIKEEFKLLNDFQSVCESGKCILSLESYSWLVNQVEQLKEKK